MREDTSVLTDEKDLVDLSIEQLADAWHREEPLLSDQQTIIRGNHRLRRHGEGMLSIQCGRGVCYVARTDYAAARALLEQKTDNAKRGILPGEDLLRGMYESHRASGTKNGLAYLVTTASSGL